MITRGAWPSQTPVSLFSAQAREVFDHARKMRGQSGGPFPSPEDWRDCWFYFLIVDRFNNPIAAPKHKPFDDPAFLGFQGGNFSGIKQQLSYIKNLGAHALCLSPVLKNLPWDSHAYHGYGIHDFLRAEPRFSDRAEHADEELRELVDAAHAAGLYVIFDIVLNHTGDVFAYCCRPDDRLCQDSRGAEASFSELSQAVQWRNEQGVARPHYPVVEDIVSPSRDALIWPIELQRNEFFRRQGECKGAPDNTVGDFAELKQMMTDNPDLQRFLIRAYQYVIARYDVDGFRIDTFRYLKGNFARLFGNAIREYALSIGKENFFTFGEVVDADSDVEKDIARFIGYNIRDQAGIIGVDAAVDYPLFGTLKPVIKGFEAPSAVVETYQRRKIIQRDILNSHGDVTGFFVTFLDNHDVKERIRYVPGNAPTPPTGFDNQVTLGLACLFSLPGIPCLYYGTEQGLHGRGTDLAVREALWGGPGFNEDSYFYREIQKIAAVRSQQRALRYGHCYFRPLSGDGHNFAISRFKYGVLAFSRILDHQEVLVVANTNTRQLQTVSVIVDRQLNKEASAYHVLYSNEKAPLQPQPVSKLKTVTIQEVDGTVGHGPVHALTVTLKPMEVQILGR